MSMSDIDPKKCSLYHMGGNKLKKKGIIIAETNERARYYAQDRFENDIVKISKDELETSTHSYKFKRYCDDILRGYRDIEELHIQYNIPVGAYFEVVLPYLSKDCRIITFH
jgi:hypothetical protein